MSERWKPENLETYWSVLDTTPMHFAWQGNPLEIARWEAGNVFKTHDQALIASIKIKSLLLSLHYNGTSTANNETLKDTFTKHLIKLAEQQADKILQKAKERRLSEQYHNGPEETKLPKLTTAVFDRPDCPKWAKYAAVDQDGMACYFANKPTISQRATWWSKNQKSKPVSLWYKFDASDWQNSWIKRPSKLPDWCKVGEWIYSRHTNSYDKITAIEDDCYYCVKTENKCHYTIGYIKEDIVPARLRPYNAEEMKALVGKVVTRKNDNAFLVTAYTPRLEENLSAVDIDNMWVRPGDVLEDYTIDNAPCGVLEHLENGEWVQ